jgi:DNA-binding LacI/PurR family transcriptional regulator
MWLLVSKRVNMVVTPDVAYQLHPRGIAAGAGGQCSGYCAPAKGGVLGRLNGRTHHGLAQGASESRRPLAPALDASWLPESGRAIGQALAKDETVTAVFCGNDEIAMGVIRGLADEGLRTPEDVSVVGFDNHPLSGLWTPPLTTAHQDFFGLSQRGFELLMARVSEEPGARRFSSERPALVIRESAAAPSAERGRSDLTA